MSDSQEIEKKHSQFENNFYSVETTEGPGCQVQFNITVKPQQVQKNYKQAVKKINKEVSVPGFRKGKAPDATVIKGYGNYVDQEWKELIIQDAWSASLDLTQIYPFKKETIQKPKIESCSLEEGAVVRIEFERYPVIPTVDFKSLILPLMEKNAVSEERFEEILKDVQTAHATFEDVEARQVQEGDYVDVSIDSIDQETPQQIVKDRRFEVSERRMAPWLKNIILNMHPGDVREVLSEVDPKASEDVKARFKPTKCSITLHSIKKAILPNLDNELAQKAGASDLEALKNTIRQNLENEANEEYKDAQYRALETVLLQNYPFEIPFSLVESERRMRIKEKILELRRHNFSDEEIKSKEAEIEKEVSLEVDASLRMYFLNKGIAEHANIRLSNKELNQELIQHMQENAMLYGDKMDKGASQEVLSHLASRLMQRKAKDYAISQIGS